MSGFKIEPMFCLTYMHVGIEPRSGNHSGHIADTMSGAFLRELDCALIGTLIVRPMARSQRPRRLTTFADHCLPNASLCTRWMHPAGVQRLQSFSR